MSSGSPQVSSIFSHLVELGHCVTTKVPASCGELMQGEIDGRDFLVNSPINLYSEVTVSRTLAQGVRVATAGQFSKVSRIVREILQKAGPQDCGVQIDIHSRVPRGKGMASSTSELAAALSATAALSDSVVTEDEISEIILAVDHSTDIVYADGITMVNHLSGEVYARYGAPPPLSFVIVDTGGVVETIGFERDKARAVARRHAGKLKKALELMKRGFASQNGRLIAAAATLSAIVNQDVLNKAELFPLLRGTLEFGGIGINCAHTGTVLGVMFDPTRTCRERITERVISLVGTTAIVGCYDLMPGGIVQPGLGAASHGVGVRLGGLLLKLFS